MGNDSLDIARIFTDQGAVFVKSPAALTGTLQQVRAFIFDWDGVFNNAVKAGEGGSPFSEADSMGINMLRFGYFLRTGEVLPVFLVTGEHNPAAAYLAGREHYQAVFRKIPDKLAVLEPLERQFGLQPDELAFVFDDILDLGLAARVALRLVVNRSGSPLLNSFIERHNLADYRTAHSGSGHAVREVCELCLGLWQQYDQAIAYRQAFHPRYQAYLAARKQIGVQYYIWQNGVIVPDKV